MSGWYDWPEYGGYRTQGYGKTVHEKEPEQKPLLYDAKGNPLVKVKRPVGFQPPKEKR